MYLSAELILIIIRKKQMNSFGACDFDKEKKNVLFH
jgi:hypothetical protein